jgi:hypothetical protein
MQAIKITPNMPRSIPIISQPNPLLPFAEAMTPVTMPHMIQTTINISSPQF